MSKSDTANEGAEALRVYAENERICGRLGIAKDLDDAADEIDRIVGVLEQAIAIGKGILADMDSAARVAPVESRGQDAAAYYSVRSYMSALERLAENKSA